MGMVMEEDVSVSKVPESEFRAAKTQDEKKALMKIYC